MTRHRSDPSALKLGPFPTDPGSGVHRVAVIRPVTLETAYTTVSDESEPTVILPFPKAIQHRQRQQARAAARAEWRSIALWMLALTGVVVVAGNVLAGLVRP